MGNIGGLLDLLFLFSGIIMSPLMKLFYHLHLSNSIFTLEENRKNRKKLVKLLFLLLFSTTYDSQ